MSLIVTVITPKFKLLMGDKNRFDNRGRKTSEVNKVVISSLYGNQSGYGLLGVIGDSEKSDIMKSSWVRSGRERLNTNISGVQYIALYNSNDTHLPANLKLNIYDGDEHISYNVDNFEDMYFVYGLGQGADYAMGYFDALFEHNPVIQKEELTSHVEDLFKKVNKLYPQVSKEFDLINL